MSNPPPVWQKCGELRETDRPAVLLLSQSKHSGQGEA